MGNWLLVRGKKRIARDIGGRRDILSIWRCDLSVGRC